MAIKISATKTVDINFCLWSQFFNLCLKSEYLLAISCENSTLLGEFILTNGSLVMIGNTDTDIDRGTTRMTTVEVSQLTNMTNHSVV